MTTTLQDTQRDTLLKLGFIYPTMMGLQPDLNPAWMKRGELTYQPEWSEGSFCDHNCVRGDGLDPQGPNGGYDCFAATDLNQGLHPKSMADFQTLRKWIDTAVSGQRLFRDDFLARGFDHYCERCEIPSEIATIYRQALAIDCHEVNLFGGNPELNDAFIDLIPYLQSAGHRVNLTTTGGRFQRDRALLDYLIAYPPNVLALSADDLTAAEILEYTSMGLEELAKRRNAIPRRRGQDRKALEGLWLAQYIQEHDNFVPVLFNTVIHERNIFDAEEMIDTLRDRFPQAIVNPYLAQSSMYDAPAVFDEPHLCEVRRLIHMAIEDTVAGCRIPKRLPFYLALEAVFMTFEDQWHVIAEYLSGYQLWQCYREHACWYLQFGRSEDVFVPLQSLTGKGGAPSHPPGGHLGCTWNAHTVTQTESIHTPLQVQSYLHGMPHMVTSTLEACQGCTMPRLMFHAISVEQGLAPILWPAYRVLRQQFVGF